MPIAQAAHIPAPMSLIAMPNFDGGPSTGPVKLIAPLKDSDPARYAAEFDKAQQAYIGNHLKSLGVDPLANALAEMQTQSEKD